MVDSWSTYAIYVSSDPNSKGLESVSIRRIQGVGYGVLEFLGVGTTFDIFQNILFPYSLNIAYCLSWIRRIGLVSFVVFGGRTIFGQLVLYDGYQISEFSNMLCVDFEYGPRDKFLKFHSTHGRERPAAAEVSPIGLEIRANILSVPFEIYLNKSTFGSGSSAEMNQSTSSASCILLVESTQSNV
ncbi:hypothetical protein Tco_0972538 [Tanacetum coccineum]